MAPTIVSDLLSPSGRRQPRFQGTTYVSSCGILVERSGSAHVFSCDASFFGFFHGTKQDYIPTPDCGKEAISAQFVHPSEALRTKGRRGDVLAPTIVPRRAMNLG